MIWFGLEIDNFEISSRNQVPKKLGTFDEYSVQPKSNNILCNGWQMRIFLYQTVPMELGNFETFCCHSIFFFQCIHARLFTESILMFPHNKKKNSEKVAEYILSVIINIICNNKINVFLCKRRSISFASSVLQLMHYDMPDAAAAAGPLTWFFNLLLGRGTPRHKTTLSQHTHTKQTKQKIELIENTDNSRPSNLNFCRFD